VRGESPLDAISTQDKTWRGLENTQEIFLTKLLYSNFNVKYKRQGTLFMSVSALESKSEERGGDNDEKYSRR